MKLLKKFPHMNTKSLGKTEEIKMAFKSLLHNKSDLDKIKQDALILMSQFLQDIDIISEEKGFKRSDIAKKIGYSSSYLTQVFRGNKPLNFITLAKIQKALEISFKIEARSLNQIISTPIKEFRITEHDNKITGEYTNPSKVSMYIVTDEFSLVG